MLFSESLRSYWQFITDEHDSGLKKQWCTAIPGGTRDIWIPSCWNELDEDLHHYDGVAWYFKEFTVPRSPDINRYTLFFNAVNYKCDVWVNGFHAASHVGGFTPFEVDISAYLGIDTRTLLSVRVDSRIDSMTVPPKGVDWFNYGGIYRDVCLQGTGTTWIDDVFVIPRIDGRVTVVVDIGNMAEHEPLSLDISVMNRDEKKEVHRDSIGNLQKKNQLQFHIDNPNLWSPESPFMYDFNLDLHAGGKLQDRWSHRIGIREFAVQGRQLLLNGKPLMLRGYSKHEEYPMLGRSFSPEIVRKDYELCKQGNCNFLRLGHYPHHLAEYLVASEAGFIIMAETPNVNLQARHFENEDVMANSINQMKEMIRYYKNETCIFLWSLFIECETTHESARKIVSDYVKLVKELDPTRFTIHASIFPLNDPTYDCFDIIGVNYWRGWYNGESIEEGSRFFDKIADLYPEKPIVVTSGGWEGIPSFHSYRAGTKWSEESQADYLDELTQMFISKDYLSGQIIWTFNDFRIDPSIEIEGNWLSSGWVMRPMEMNFKGVLDLYRRPKLSYYRLKETFKGWERKLARVSTRQPPSGSGE
jgi:beta-glucuronidase